MTMRIVNDKGNKILETLSILLTLFAPVRLFLCMSIRRYDGLDTKQLRSFLKQVSLDEAKCRLIGPAIASICVREDPKSNASCLPFTRRCKCV